MSNKQKQAIKTASKKTTEYTHVPWVASFKKSDKRAGFYEAVNKRARKALGRKTYATKDELKKLDGYHNVKVYTTAGVLRTV